MARSLRGVQGGGVTTLAARCVGVLASPGSVKGVLGDGSARIFRLGLINGAEHQALLMRGTGMHPAPTPEAPGSDFRIGRRARVGLRS